MNVELNISELSFTATFSSSNEFIHDMNYCKLLHKSGPAEPVVKWGGGLMRTCQREETKGTVGLLTHIL